MTNDQLKRARWVQNSPHTHVLKACVKDGGAVLATIIDMPLHYAWQVGSKSGSHMSFYGAQRAARKALREAQDAANNEAG